MQDLPSEPNGVERTAVENASAAELQQLRNVLLAIRTFEGGKKGLQRKWTKESFFIRAAGAVGDSADAAMAAVESVGVDVVQMAAVDEK